MLWIYDQDFLFFLQCKVRFWPMKLPDEFWRVVVCLLYLQLPVGWFCTPTGYNSLDALIFLSPVKTQIIQNCLKLKTIQERKVFSLFCHSQGLR